MQQSRIGVYISALAILARVACAYEFSGIIREAEPNNTTGLTTNEESRIYGGSEADVRQYPYIASLRFDPHGKTFCGGTLVAPQFILTAGHCIKTDKGQIYASLGSKFGSGSGSSELIKVTKGFRHPLYNNAKHLYDVGLLKLKTPSTQKVAPLGARDGSDSKVGTMATVLGWGLTEDRVGSFTLQKVNVAIISNAECNKEYGRNRITGGMMCAGNGEGKDSCNGDSGGPLLANDAVVGLVSWGGKCGVKAGVYTRVAHVLDYIKAVLNGATDSLFPRSASSAESSAHIALPRRSTAKANTKAANTTNTTKPTKTIKATKSVTKETQAAEASISKQQ